MSTLPEFIQQMDEATARAYILETFKALEDTRFMFPSQWRQSLTGDVLNKYIVMVEVQPKIQYLQGETLLRRLALHAYDVAQWAQLVAEASATTQLPTDIENPPMVVETASDPATSGEPEMSSSFPL